VLPKFVPAPGIMMPAKPETNGLTCLVTGCSLHLLLIKNMATAMTGLFCRLNNKQFECAGDLANLPPSSTVFLNLTQTPASVNCRSKVMRATAPEMGQFEM
jgi:hypothetical protein